MDKFDIGEYGIMDIKESSGSVSFTKDHTMMVKGVLIIMLLSHHVFAADDAMPYNIDTITNNTLLFYNAAAFFRVCIAGFAFLTAYGMTQTFRSKEKDDPKTLFFMMIRRLIKLELTIAFVYIIAVLYRGFVMGQSVMELYADGCQEGEKWPVMLLHMFIDMTGMATYAETAQINITWWYLSYAVILIIAMPFIYLAYRKFRWLLIPAGCLLPYVILNTEIFFSLLLPAVILGTAFSYENWFGKIKYRNRKQAVIGLAVCLLIIYIDYLCYIHTNAIFSFILAVVIPCFVYQYIAVIPIVNTCLKFLGKHATNMFLIHTFIYRYYYPDFIYSFHYAWLILPVLLCVSLGVSILIELLKKITCYHHLTGRILQYIDSKEMAFSENH